MKIPKKLIVLILTVAFLTESAGAGMFTQHPTWCWALRPMASKNSHPVASSKASRALPGYTEETIEALERTGGNRKEAAKILHILEGPVYVRIDRIRTAAILLNTSEAKEVLERLKKVASLSQKKAVSLPSFTEETIGALEETNGNRTKAAKILNLTLKSILWRIDKIQAAAMQLNTEEAKTVLERLKKIEEKIEQRKNKLPDYASRIIKALEETGGDLSQAAKILDIHPSVISRRMERIQTIANALNTEEAKAIQKRLKRIQVLLRKRSPKARSRRRKAIKEMIKSLSRKNHLYDKNGKIATYRYKQPYSPQEVIDAILSYQGLERVDLVVLSKSGDKKIAFYAGGALGQYDEQYDGEKPEVIDDTVETIDGFNFKNITEDLSYKISELIGLDINNLSPAEKNDITAAVCRELAYDLSSQHKETIENKELLEKLFEMARLTYREKIIFIAVVGYDEPYKSKSDPSSLLSTYFKISPAGVQAIKERVLKKLQHAAAVWNKKYGDRDTNPAIANHPLNVGLENIQKQINSAA